MKRITALLCALLLLLSLSACGKTSTPEETAETFFAAMQKMDFDGMNACATADAQMEWNPGGGGFSGETEQQLLDVFKKLAAKMEYTIGEATVSDTTATVPATVTFVDAAPLVRDMMTDVMANMVMTLLGEENEDDVYTQMIRSIAEKVDTATLSTQTVDLQLALSKTDDGWKISAWSDELANVLSANMSDAFADAAASLTK